MDESAEQMRERYVAVMGEAIGDHFHRLTQQNAFLHLKWNEYVALFGKSERQIADMNRAAPGFFWLVQEAWWDDIILHIFRMIDRRKDVLSVHRLKSLLDREHRTPADFGSLLAALVEKADFARLIRNQSLAHKKVEGEHRIEPLPPVSRNSIREALAALDALLHCVDHSFTKNDPTMYDHLDARGGSSSLVWHVRRGLKARDDDFGSRRPPVRFDD